MHPAEVEACLESMVCLCDSREQDTPRLRQRLKDINLPIERTALKAGDYGAMVLLPSGEWYELPIVIERKMDIDELCMCFCQQRGRFKREFERARIAQKRLYLLIEGATWEKIYNGQYRSNMRSRSLIASILSWVARYDCEIIFCSSRITGGLIRDILWYEAKEILTKMEGDESG